MKCCFNANFKSLTEATKLQYFWRRSKPTNFRRWRLKVETFQHRNRRLGLTGAYDFAGGQETSFSDGEYVTRYQRVCAIDIAALLDERSLAPPTIDRAIVDRWRSLTRKHSSLFMKYVQPPTPMS